jgi:hypothetical protein
MVQREASRVAVAAGFVLVVLLAVASRVDAAPKTPEEIFLKPEKQIYAFDIPIEPAVSIMLILVLFGALKNDYH